MPLRLAAGRPITPDLPAEEEVEGAVSSQVSFSTIQFEINSRRPLTAGIRWNGGGGHRVVLRGWYDPTRVDVADPWYAGGVVSYSDLQTGYGMGTWYGTMTNIH